MWVSRPSPPFCKQVTGVSKVVTALRWRRKELAGALVLCPSSVPQSNGVMPLRTFRVFLKSGVPTLGLSVEVSQRIAQLVDSRLTNPRARRPSVLRGSLAVTMPSQGTPPQGVDQTGALTSAIVSKLKGGAVTAST